MPNELKQYRVIRTDFEHLENWLNDLEKVFPKYEVIKVVEEHSYDGALANIILRLKEVYDDAE